MSQLDTSIFYSHLFSLLMMLYIFAHFSVIILTTYYYNNKVRLLEGGYEVLTTTEISKTEILNKILE